MPATYELSIDGNRYVDTLVDATLARIETAGGSSLHPSPMSLQPAFFVSGPHRGLLDWVAATLNRQVFRRDIAVRSTDLHSGKSFSQQLFHCLLEDFALPALDKASNADAYLKCHVMPERIENQAEDKRVVAAPPKPWKVRDFNFSINGINADAVASVSAITVRQGIKRIYTGSSRFPDMEPTRLEERNFVITMPTAKAGEFAAWQKASFTTAAGAMGRRGSLEYLDPQKKVLLGLAFEGLLLVNMQQSGTDSKVELAYESISV